MDALEALEEFVSGPKMKQNLGKSSSAKTIN